MKGIKKAKITSKGQITIPKELREKMKREININKIFKMIHQMDIKEQLLLIAKIAEGIPYTNSPKKPRKPISYYKAFGMWKNRKDMKDAVSWVQGLRRKEERRIYTNERNHA